MSSPLKGLQVGKKVAFDLPPQFGLIGDRDPSRIYDPGT